MKNLDEISFWHKVPLLDGTMTPGRVPLYQMKSQYLFDRLKIQGKSVLDIGCWDGYFCFESERLGASRVVGLDDPDYRWGGMDGFNFLKKHFGSRIVEWKKGSIYTPPEEKFDIVLCYGVIYHLSDPLLAARNAFNLCNSQIIFEGLFNERPEPTLTLLEPFHFASDDSNTYIASYKWLELVANMSGFRFVERHVENEFRGTMLFERVLDTERKHRDHCFPVKPTLREGAQTIK